MDCKVCSAPTGSNRPYCGAHIDNSPYVMLLRQYNRNRTKESRISDRLINLNGLLATEMLEFLIERPRKRTEIYLQTDMSLLTANRYIKALKKAGYIIQDWMMIDTDGDRDEIFKLTPKGLAHYRHLIRPV